MSKSYQIEQSLIKQHINKLYVYQTIKMNNVLTLSDNLICPHCNKNVKNILDKTNIQKIDNLTLGTENLLFSTDCVHYFCYDCIMNLINHLTYDDQNRYYLPCPHCKTQTFNLNLKNNYISLDSLNNLNKKFNHKYKTKHKKIGCVIN